MPQSHNFLVRFRVSDKTTQYPYIYCSSIQAYFRAYFTPCVERPAALHRRSTDMEEAMQLSGNTPDMSETFTSHLHVNKTMFRLAGRCTWSRRCSSAAMHFGLREPYEWRT